MWCTFEKKKKKKRLAIFCNPRFLIGAKYPFTRHNTSRNGAQVLDGPQVETDWQSLGDRSKTMAAMEGG